jgi:hypothetical protein
MVVDRLLARCSNQLIAASNDAESYGTVERLRGAGAGIMRSRSARLRLHPPPDAAALAAARSPWAWWARSWPSGEETFQKALRLVNGSVHGFEPQGAWDDRAAPCSSASCAPPPSFPLLRASERPRTLQATQPLKGDLDNI